MSAPAQAAALEPREIRGPSAFGGDRRRFWSLLWLNARVNFRTRYIHSVLGYAWSLLRPLLFFAVLLVVFTRVIRFGGTVENYAAMLVFNIMLFQFFTDAAGSAVTCVVARESLVRKTQFPRIVIPLSVVLNALMTTVMNVIATLILIVAIGVEPQLTWLLIPVVLLVMLVFLTGVALVLSASYVRFRDVQQIWTVIARALFYATPVLYPIELVSDRLGGLSDVVLANPLAPILAQARIWVVDPSAPSVADVASSGLVLLIPLAIFLGTCALGLWLFERAAPGVAERL